jgi:hypothetical protein
MKKIILFLFGAFVTLALSAQPPQRPLPNQFRDFVDHQKRWNTERPNIEKKDGKVIITMSEDQFRRMQMMRQRPPMMMVRQFHHKCDKCEHKHKKHMRKRRM